MPSRKNAMRFDASASPFAFAAAFSISATARSHLAGVKI
jgi:hypothetical protein